MKRVLAVSSIGGHWIQLLRIAKPLTRNFEVTFVCTHEKCATMVEEYRFYKIHDFSRWNAYKLIPAFFRALKLLKLVKPDAIITTGAAPGFVCLLVAKIYGVKTIWIDSIANVEELSGSGKMAKKIADRVYTQWPDLASEEVIYAGNIFGD